MKHSTGRMTRREKDRDAILRQLRPLEIHHIVRGNKRLGHWYTLQLCVGHHQGEYTDQPIRVGIHSGRHAFKEQYGYDELELWQRQQVALRLDDELPKSKRVPRRSHELPSDVVEFLATEARVPTLLPRNAGDPAETGIGPEAAEGVSP